LNNLKLAAMRRLFFFMALLINYTVGDPGAPANGATNYYNAGIAGKKIKVFREGLYQHRSGVNFIIVPGNGAIIFIPAQWEGERVRIQTI
jgi:hypothetical protein